MRIDKWSCAKQMNEEATMHNFVVFCFIALHQTFIYTITSVCDDII